MSLFQLPVYSSIQSKKSGQQIGSSDDGGSTDEEVVTKSKARRGKHISLRYQHLDVLNTLVHKCIVDKRWKQAHQAFAMLIRCKDVDIRLCWEEGYAILEHTDMTGLKAAEFLSRLIVAYPPIKPRRGRQYDRADVFVRILTQHRIKHEEWELSAQELEAWLLVPPYKDDIALWKHLSQVLAVLRDAASTAGQKSEARRLNDRLAKVNAVIAEKLRSDIHDNDE